MNFDIKKTLLDATEYVSGYVNDDDDYVISASMVAKDPLQNYLSIIHGKVHTEEIDDTTLGSVFHRGMEEIMKDKVKEDNGTSQIVGIEKSMHTKLANGWVLSGTADLITMAEDGNFSIHDYKLSKMYTKKMIKKELHTHDYTKQLQVLDALFRENGGGKMYGINGDIDLCIEFFAKDAKAIEFEQTHETIFSPNKRGSEDMDATEVMFGEVIAVTDSLQSYIEAGQVPPICADRWPRNVKGKIINTKCSLYCSHGKAGLCPHFDPKGRREMDRISNW